MSALGDQAESISLLGGRFDQIVKLVKEASPEEMREVAERVSRVEMAVAKEQLSALGVTTPRYGEEARKDWNLQYVQNYLDRLYRARAEPDAGWVQAL